MIRLIRHDLAWAGFILLLAVAFGMGTQWRLVRLSWTGGLPAFLAQQQEQRRRVEFQGVKTINLAQAYEIFQQKKALFIDARKADEFNELHIPGAINLPPQRLAKEGTNSLKGIPIDRQLVVYCSQASCNLSLEVAERLQTLGYTRVSAFMGGFRAWDEAGYPADTNK
jgi:rhodanese-related sulfurtransferase